MLLLASAAHAAEVPRPAASLLVPRFEVSVDRPAFNTVFVVRNESELPQIVRVKFHTDLGFASIWYSTALLPHGSTTVDMYSVFSTGRWDYRGLPKSPVNPKHAADAGRFCPDDESYGKMGWAGGVLRHQLTNGCAQAGMIGCAGVVVGQRHAHAIGYAVVDLMPACLTDERAPRLDEAVLSGAFEQRAFGRVVASGPLVPMPLSSSVTLRVPPGRHDVVVWRGPEWKPPCGTASHDVFEITHVDAKRARTLTFEGAEVWAMVTEPMPADPAAQPPQSGCPAVVTF